MKKILLSVMLLSGCLEPGKQVSAEDANGNFDVKKLFMVDGCTVYRFADGLSDHYFTTCQGSTTQQVNCGKNCTRAEEIQTEKR